TYPEVSLKQARDRRDAARKQIADGIDPSAQRQAQKAKLARDQSGTFEAVAREWFAKFRGSWVAEHAETVIHRLEADVLPWIGHRPIAAIDAPELLELLRRIEARGAVSTAHRIKQIIGQINRYAIATGRASRDASADLRGALIPERERHFGAVTT